MISFVIYGKSIFNSSKSASNAVTLAATGEEKLVATKRAKISALKVTNLLYSIEASLDSSPFSLTKIRELSRDSTPADKTVKMLN